MRRMNAAFFTLNGIISVLFFCAVAAAVMLHR
jgi:4-hydroxybenzoate polyprenyltransferase